MKFIFFILPFGVSEPITAFILGKIVPTLLYEGAKVLGKGSLALSKDWLTAGLWTTAQGSFLLSNAAKMAGRGALQAGIMLSSNTWNLLKNTARQSLDWRETEHLCKQIRAGNILKAQALIKKKPLDPTKIIRLVECAVTEKQLGILTMLLHQRTHNFEMAYRQILASRLIHPSLHPRYLKRILFDGENNPVDALTIDWWINEYVPQILSFPMKSFHLYFQLFVTVFPVPEEHRIIQRLAPIVQRDSFQCSIFRNLQLYYAMARPHNRHYQTYLEGAKAALPAFDFFLRLVKIKPEGSLRRYLDRTFTKGVKNIAKIARTEKLRRLEKFINLK